MPDVTNAITKKQLGILIIGTGLAADTPVIAGTGDSFASILGCGAVLPGDMMIYLGTSGTQIFMNGRFSEIVGRRHFGPGKAEFAENAILVLSLNSLSSPDTSQTTVKIVPGNNNICLNSSATIDVVVDSVSNLGAFEFDLIYNGQILKVDSSSHIILGSFLSTTNRNVSPLGPEIDNETGYLKFGGFSFGSNQGPTGSGILASITWTTHDTGSAVLEFQNIQLTDTEGKIIPISHKNATFVVNDRFWADINGDDFVNIVDIQIVAGKWNSQIGDPLYDPICDVNDEGKGDGRIDIVDLQLVAWWWHKELPGLNSFTLAKIISNTSNEVTLELVSAKEEEDDFIGYNVLIDNAKKVLEKIGMEEEIL